MEVPLLGDEPRDVEHRHADECAAEVGAVPLVGHLADDLDAVEFVPVGDRRQK